MAKDEIASILQESRKFPPPAEFRKNARVASRDAYQKMWQESVDHPEKFWGKVAEQTLSWNKSWKSVLEWKCPDAKWFGGGEINATYNCVDRHAENPTTAKKTALIWEGEPGDKRKFNYAELKDEVTRFAECLQLLGLEKGDRATIYMPLIPELIFAMLACARLGVTHSVVFGGFSAEALADRNNDAKAKVLITADGGYRRGQILNLKTNVDIAVDKSPTISKVLVVKRSGENVAMRKDRDFWFHELKTKTTGKLAPVSVDSEHPLFILYTSGSTGKPKGVLHTTAGYLLGAAVSFQYIFDHRDSDIFWCTADPGWITGHSYVVYGPLCNAATLFLYEGAPATPDPGRFWKMIEENKISVLYTAPTAIRSFMKSGNTWPEKYDLSSLRLLGTVGEPINPEAWIWYHEIIGKKRCPIIDTWWQTETGGIMISAFPGAIDQIPGCATVPFFGIRPEVVDKHGKAVPTNQGGFLVISQPWPSMLRTVYGDHERYKQQYWSHTPGQYFTGDGARKDEDGNFWILGRIDDVLNVSGHRLSTMEVESSLVSHPSVAEAAVVGKPHDVKGEAIFAFVTLKSSEKPSDELKQTLMKHVTASIGALARPDEIRFADTLPKTRSGKIMRRLLRDIAAGKTGSGDTSTLEDLAGLEKLRADEAD